MGETNGVVDEGFLRRYRVLLDAEAGAFDELEHAYEDGDRAHYESDLEEWRISLGRRTEFLTRHGLVPRPARKRTGRSRAGA
jgi:hypothetical protein